MLDFAQLAISFYTYDLLFQTGGRFRATPLGRAAAPAGTGGGAAAAAANGFEEVELTPIDAEEGAAKGKSASAGEGSSAKGSASGVSVESAESRRLILPDISFLVSELAAHHEFEPSSEGINAEEF